MLRFARLLILVASCGGTWTLAAEPEREFSAEDLEFFEKEVRPILVERCDSCHGSGAKEPKGGLRTDSRIALLAGGDTGPAIVPGDPGKSLLIDAINYGELYQMPPKSRLPAGEVATLTKWVARGAPWPKEVARGAAESGFNLAARQAEHWCWRPVKPVTPPAVQNAGWPSVEWDRFILAKLEEQQLPPARPAAKHIWARRVFFDLTGLPPTPEQLQAFLQDPSPQAYEKLVDQLLDSPHFGERWARHWMDLVRYAETCGHEFDYPIREAWRYRDYLIRAFNDDLPYDQFVVEHIAGDLLEKPRLHPTEQFNESILGTMFWWLHEAIHAPVDVRGDEAGRIDNQIDVFSKTFLGLTVACARCHDHKFDAISTKDYYALAGFLRSTRRHETMLDPGGRIRAAAQAAAAVKQAGDSQLKQHVQAGLAKLNAEQLQKYLLASRAAVARTAAAAEAPENSLAPERLAATAADWSVSESMLRAWLTALQAAPAADSAQPLSAWTKLALRGSAEPETSRLETLRKELATRQLPPTDADAGAGAAPTVFVDFGSADESFGTWTAAGEAFGTRPTGSGEWDTTVETPQWVTPGVAHSGQLSPKFQGVLRSPSFTLSSRNIFYRIAGRDCEVRLIIDGYTMIEFHQLLFGGCKFGVNTDRKWIWHRQSGDLGMYLGHRAYIEVIDHGDGWVALDKICFSDQETPPEEIEHDRWEQFAVDPAVDSLEKFAAGLAREMAAGLQRWGTPAETDRDRQLVQWLWQHGLLAGEAKKRDELHADEIRRLKEATKGVSSPIRVVSAMDGNGENERIFIRGNPRVLGEEAPRQLLTALVGEPHLVASGSGRLQLARQVADPTNPLTSRVLVNRVWHYLFGVGLVPSTDNFGVLGETPSHPELLDYLADQFVREGWSVKRLVRSIVLSSTYRMSSAPDALADERDPNNRLWHRTNIRRLEGEAIRDAMLAISGRLDPQRFGPSVPVHITPFMQGRGRPGNSGPLDGAGRRSIYLEVRRNFLSPMMLAFDTPIPFSTVGRRNVSNVPAQALILMNDPFVAEQAKLWGDRLLEEQPSFDQRVERAYWSAIGRGPTGDETAAVEAFFVQQAQEAGMPVATYRDTSPAWADFCQVLFNLKEFTFVQ